MTRMLKVQRGGAITLSCGVVERSDENPRLMIWWAGQWCRNDVLMRLADTFRMGAAGRCGAGKFHR